MNRRDMLKLGTAGLAVVVVPSSAAADVPAGLPVQIVNKDLLVNRNIYSRLQELLDSLEWMAEEQPFEYKLAWSDCGNYCIDWREWKSADLRTLWLDRLWLSGDKWSEEEIAGMLEKCIGTWGYCPACNEIHWNKP